MESIKQLVEWCATLLEIITVLVIVLASVFGTIRFLLHLSRQTVDAYEQYKSHLGKMLMLALEFLVAADVIRTVALEQTFANIGMLGLLVLIRTFLSWSLAVEVEGHFPWKKGEEKTEVRTENV